MMQLKLLLQGLNILKRFHQLANILKLLKKVNNTPIEIYTMHLIFF